MESLEAELDRARELEVSDLADAIESIGFECTRCGACCTASEARPEGAPRNGERGAERSESSEARPEGAPRNGERGAERSANSEADDPHTATLFPDEVRELQRATAERDDFEREYDWRDVARPMPYGLHEGPDGPAGETFEWALQVDACGDCTFYTEDEQGTGACTVHDSRPLICRTYPFSVALGGTSQPMGEAVDREGLVRAHECEGLGREITREAAEDLARALKERAIRELEEAIAVRDRYAPAEPGDGEVVVHDSEGAKRPDGTRLDGEP